MSTPRVQLLTPNAEKGADGVGVASITQTTTSTDDNGSNVITVTLTNGVTSTFVVKNGSKGSTGATGATGPQGEQGEQGDAGVGIASVEHTTTSSEDDGRNIITVTLTDGTQSTFWVKNGSQGSKGDTGATGKTGADGYTPVKGTDYFTDEDKAEIVAEVVSETAGKLDANDLSWNESSSGSDTVNILSRTSSSGITSSWTSTGFSVEDDAGQGVELAKAAINLKANSSTLFGTPKQEVIIDAGSITVSNLDEGTDVMLKYPNLPDGTATTIATLEDIVSADTIQSMIDEKFDSIVNGNEVSY